MAGNWYDGEARKGPVMIYQQLPLKGTASERYLHCESGESQQRHHRPFVCYRPLSRVFDIARLKIEYGSGVFGTIFQGLRERAEQRLLFCGGHIRRVQLIDTEVKCRLSCRTVCCVKGSASSLINFGVAAFTGKARPSCSLEFHCISVTEKASVKSPD